MKPRKRGGVPDLKKEQRAARRCALVYSPVKPRKRGVPDWDRALRGGVPDLKPAQRAARRYALVYSPVKHEART